MKTEKADEYAIKIMTQIQDMFDEDCDNHIDSSEFEDEKNATSFVYALSNLAPCLIVQRLTNEKYDALGFNHMVNRLAAQFSNFVSDK